jgi:MFS family permease
MQQYLSNAELKAWGWRIPFAIGAVAAVVAFFLRRSLAETTSADVRKRALAGTIRGVFRYPRSFFTVLGFTAGGSLVFYTFTTYMQKYLVNTAGMDARTASKVMTMVLFCYMLMQPLFGALSDRIGRRTSMICFGVFTVVATVPILSALGHVSDPYTAFGLVILALAGVSFYVDQRAGEGRAFPDARACARRRALLCDRQCGIRWQRRVRRAVVQVDRDRVDFLLVCDRHVRHIADRGDHDAGHAAQRPLDGGRGETAAGLSGSPRRRSSTWPSPG